MTAAQIPGPYGVRMGGTTCAVHRHRELVPIHSHHIWPLGDGGPDKPHNRVDVCANGHYSIHALLDALIDGAGKVPWTQRRLYGRKVRAYADAGWRAIAAARKAAA
jgi:hypothetical protein